MCKRRYSRARATLPLYMNEIFEKPLWASSEMLNDPKLANWRKRRRRRQPKILQSFRPMSLLRKRTDSLSSASSTGGPSNRSRQASIRTILGLATPFPVVELLPGRFYFTVAEGSFLSVNSEHCGLSSRKPHVFSIDNELVYDPFAMDFGPLNLGHVHSYLEKVHSLVQGQRRPLVHYCSNEPRKRRPLNLLLRCILFSGSNAVFLACAYLVIHCSVRPHEAFSRVVNGGYNSFLPFRDATSGPCSYKCTILDCLEGLYRARRIGWYVPSHFDKEQYQYYEKVENGDLNWIIPGKFLAFAGPHPNRHDAHGYLTLMPEDYYDVFKDLGITLVIRLNKKSYDRSRFTEGGFAHADLYFPDGSCPPQHIINSFLSLCESAPGAIAVHCKAGLGRTGSLIGIYAMKHYGFPARAWIGWNRICRPGSVLGPQQQFLCDMERLVLRRASLDRSPSNSLIPLKIDVKLSRDEAKEDTGQGERLTSAKKTGQLSRRLSNSSSPIHSSTIRGFFGRVL